MLNIAVVTSGSYSAREFRFFAHEESGPQYGIVLTAGAATMLLDMLRAWGRDNGLAV